MPPGIPDSQAAAERQQHRARLIHLVELFSTRMRSLRNSGEWSEVELTMPQFRALDLLHTRPRRMGDIAAALGTSMQATTSLIDRLVDKGLVERRHDEADRRVVTCALTPAGRDEVERVYRIGQARIDLLVDVLTDDELERVIEAFAVLADASLRLKTAGSPGVDRPVTTRAEAPDAGGPLL